LIDYGLKFDVDEKRSIHRSVMFNRQHPVYLAFAANFFFHHPTRPLDTAFVKRLKPQGKTVRKS
jgi:hypothetical protein